MPKVAVNGVTIAESETVEELEGVLYFPPASLKMDYFTPVSKTTSCPWRGTASYYDVTVDGNTMPGAAWQYKTPKDLAANIKVGASFYISRNTLRSIKEAP
jgi:uncharacterized protein (DUF427 family)